MPGNRTRSLAERFWEKVTVRGADECWPWTAATNEHGYGVMRPLGQRTGPTIKAHRVSAQLAGMDIEGKVVRHTCDNPPCCNPAHLLIGTQQENLADMVARRRVSHGSSHWRAKLTEDAVRQIRSMEGTATHKEIASMFGVSRTLITRLMNGEGWRHV